LRNKVHLNHAGCLGPCALANVIMLIFDGRPIWFHSLNDERLILAVFDYIDAMLAADRYLPAPAALSAYIFNGFAWDGTEGRNPEIDAISLEVADAEKVETAVAGLRSSILFLSHADTDLLTFARANTQLAAEFADADDAFPTLNGQSLLTLPSADHVRELIRNELDDVQVIVLRTLGGRQGFPHGFDLLVQAAQQLNIDLICVPGTVGLDPELTAYSTVPVTVIHDVYRYLHFGGVDNFAQMMRFLADHLLAGGWGYEQPAEQPQHGIYSPTHTPSPALSPKIEHAEMSDIKNGVEDRERVGVRGTADDPSSNVTTSGTVGILFYRSHYLSGNTDFVDALVDAIEANGGQAIPVFTTSLKDMGEAKEDGQPIRPAAFDYFYADDGTRLVDCVISTISFAMGGINSEGVTQPSWNVDALTALDVPMLQAITSGMDEQEWRLNLRGLRPLDVAMNVALPEFDGRIITVPISFKGEGTSVVDAEKPHPNPPQLGEGTDNSLPRQQLLPQTGEGREEAKLYQSHKIQKVPKYVPIADRVAAVAKQAMRWATLRRKPNAEKRVAFVLTNSPGKADRIGNAVGLDTPMSMLWLFERMREAGYKVEDWGTGTGDLVSTVSTAPLAERSQSELVEASDALLHELIDRCSYDEIILTESQLARAAGRVAVDSYSDWFGELTHSQQSQMNKRWGDAPGEAYVHIDDRGREQHIALAGIELENVFIALQPPRGYGMDPDAIYHTPDLPPPHNYYALYKWLAESQDEGGWGADAIVHMGKHGTLEWLPGKGVGLSNECFPDAFLAELPLIYPFIINNPGEGAQAKRRGHAVIIDHMIPPMTSADVYGELALLTQLVDEYYQVEQMDPSKLPLVQKQIWELMQQTNLDKDLGEMMNTIDHGDHTHEWDGSFTEDGTPVTLAEMSGTDFAHLLEDMDGYLCELGSLQIRDGLHILGHVPRGDQLCNLLRALTRIPNGNVPSLRAALANQLGYVLSELLDSRGERLADGVWSTDLLGEEKRCQTHADIIELIDSCSLLLLQRLDAHNFGSEAIDGVLGEMSFGPLRGGDLHAVLAFVCDTLVPLVRQNDAEIANVIGALDGRYVPAGPAGAPTRGMAHILPTGRNFYAVDPRAIPSQAAWRVGGQLADELLARYIAEEGALPESVGLSIWGTSAMRTHGDDIAQCFALLGVRPIWQPESRRITDVEPVPLAELGRPRVDVLMRISGFFRDAFPHLIDLMDRAVRLVIELDEPLDQNFVRKHYLEDLARQIGAGKDDAEAGTRAGYRVFGSKPGSYGAGILPLIHEQNWENEADFAQAYINWGGYAYGAGVYGDDARDEFRTTLGGVQVAVKNQDNREHDIFDSDDYLQYHGGMIATIRSLNGRNPKSYFGDNSDPERAQVRSLAQEAQRVFRSRVVNPKWIEGIQRHGYKGALELSATVEYLFGYDATAQVVDDWMYEQTAQTYALDATMQEFFAQSNPWALQAISERLLEAAQRGMWSAPDKGTLEKLKEIYLRMDGELEGRGE